MAAVPQFAPDTLVLVLFQEDTTYSLDYGTLLLPQGTRLIGIWSAEQPGESAIYAVEVSGTLWHFAIPNTTVSPLEASLHPQAEQERIALESLRLAEAEEREKHPNGAQRLYAQAIVELEASGEQAVGKIADARFKRAFLLKEIGAISEAIMELDALSRSYEGAVTLGYGMIDRDYAELAAQSLNALGRTILHHTDPTTEQQRLHQVVNRMLKAIQPIARRYVTKVEVLLTAAEIYSRLQNTKEALSLFTQADTLYYNQLATAPRIDAVALHLDRVRKELGQPERKQQKTRRSSQKKKKKS